MLLLMAIEEKREKKNSSHLPQAFRRPSQHIVRVADPEFGKLDLDPDPDLH